MTLPVSRKSLPEKAFRKYFAEQTLADVIIYLYLKNREINYLMLEL